MRTNITNTEDSKSGVDKIDNVLEWMKCKLPYDWKLEQDDPQIDTELTFSWMMAHLTNVRAIDERLGHIDTAPRNTLLDEAIKRLFDGMINQRPSLGKDGLVEILLATPDKELWRQGR